VSCISSFLAREFISDASSADSLFHLSSSSAAIFLEPVLGEGYVSSKILLAY